jgi:hypothetical protein
MALPGLVAARNLADVADRERAWDNLGLNIGANLTAPESTAYIEAVETADAAFLEEEVKAAIHAFVVGCKIDGIWPAIKASCILAGARTLNGALVPLVGAAPTNVSGLLVSGDYNRKSGIKGDGIGKSLSTGYIVPENKTNDSHVVIYETERSTTTDGFLFGMGRVFGQSGNIGAQGPLTTNAVRVTLCSATSSSVSSYNTISGPITIGAARNNSASHEYIVGTNSGTTTDNSSFNSSPIHVFSRTSALGFSSPRVAFYSAGDYLSLSQLDLRLAALHTAFAAAIP